MINEVKVKRAFFMGLKYISMNVEAAFYPQT